MNNDVSKEVEQFVAGLKQSRAQDRVVSTTLESECLRQVLEMQGDRSIKKTVSWLVHIGYLTVQEQMQHAKPGAVELKDRSNQQSKTA